MTKLQLRSLASKFARGLRRHAPPPRDLSTHYLKQFHPELGCSQSGEDGILAEMFRRLGVERGWFVEFGAWDGVLYSNTYALAERGWSGVGIECDQAKFGELQENMRRFGGYHPVRRFVQPTGPDSLDAILAETPIPRDFDLLSIDIDGNDYWIWKSLALYRPKVVVVEYNCEFGPHEAKTIPFDERHMWDGESIFFGASAAALTKLGKAKGYSLVAYTSGLNVFLVRDDLVAGRFDVVPVERVPTQTNKVVRRRDEFVDV